MLAVRLHQRGGPERIVVEEAPTPVPAAGEVRIAVRAAALTPTELTWDQTYQHPDGSTRLPTIPGHDVAGIVNALGSGVSDLHLGDVVYALVNFPFNGSAAEFVVLPAAEVASAPRTLDLVHAAAVPLSGLTAWQGLFDHGQLGEGDRVLIHGIGGVGGFAIQLARWRKAHVLVTASPANLQLARDLGATEVIDYTSVRFEQVAREVDLVFDTVGHETLTRSFDAIRRGGRIVSVASKPDSQLAAEAGVTAVFFIVKPSQTELEQIAKLIDAGELCVNVEEIFPLAQARQAFERAIGGHLTGKVVLQV